MKEQYLFKCYMFKANNFYHENNLRSIITNIILY